MFRCLSDGAGGRSLPFVDGAGVFAWASSLCIGGHAGTLV